MKLRELINIFWCLTMMTGDHWWSMIHSINIKPITTTEFSNREIPESIALTGADTTHIPSTITNAL